MDSTRVDEEATVLWTYGYTNWDLQRDEGHKLGLIDIAPLRIWHTAEGAKKAAEEDHRQEWQSLADEDPKFREDYLFRPLEWVAVQYDRFGDGRDALVYTAGEEEVETYWVYPVRLVE